MAVSINGTTGIINCGGTGSITGISTITGLPPGGLPDNCITDADIAYYTITPLKLAQPMTLVAQVNTNNGGAVNFTGIPNWVKRITILLDGVSINSTTVPLVRIATSTGFVDSGYVSGGTFLPAGAGAVYHTSTTGFVIPAASASAVHSGIIQICNISSNTWIYSYAGVNTGESASSVAGGTKSLSAILDRVRITTNSANQFQSGAISIMYEG
jgi:hypothetical protein